MLASLSLALVVFTPQPKELTFSGGTFRLNPDSRIVAVREFIPAARILQSDLRRLTGVRLTLSTDPARAGDIEFRKGGGAGAYSLFVGDRAVIRAADNTAANWATTTLLQSVKGRDLPQMQVRDWSDYGYRGVMLDLARKPHTIDGIKQIVDLCRVYKLNYLHLHLSDDHLFMFPSQAFPGLGKGNHEFARFDPPSTDEPIRPYTRAELRDLERYAVDRGVTIIPEIDMPGHGSRLTQDAPETFRASEQNPSTINIAGPRTVAAAKTLLTELAGTFPSSPYIHLGGDEVWLGGLEGHPDFVSSLAKLNEKDPQVLYRRFVADMVSHIRSLGKRAIVWEEAYGASLPKDAIVMAWSINGPIQQMLNQGYAVINAGWTPLYIVRDDKRPPRFMEGWNPTLFGSHTASFRDWTLASGPGLLGAQICSWENPESAELQSLRVRAPILAERGWNRSSRGVVRTRDDLVEALATDVSIIPTGALVRDESTFEAPLTVEMRSAVGQEIRYRMDNRLPTATSPIYEGPITLTGSAWIRAQAFDRRGRPIGRASGAWFNYRPKFVPNLATGSMGPKPRS